MTNTDRSKRREASTGEARADETNSSRDTEWRPNMGEAIWCNITVMVPSTWHPVDSAPVGALALLDAGLCNGYMTNDMEDVDGITELQFEGEGNYGLYDDEVSDALDMLVAARVPFLATSDSKYECEAEWRLYDGNADGTIITRDGTNDQIMLTEAGWKEIVEGTHAWATSIEEYFKGRDIAAANAAHLLGTDCPWTEE